MTTRLLLTLAVFAAIATPIAAAEPASKTPVDVRYTLGLLVRGPAWTPGRTPRTDSIQAGHLANIGRMAQSGALVAAGPFEGGGTMRGLFVFAPGATGLDSLMAGDPAIASGRLECRLHPWLAAPGLGEEYKRRAASKGRSGQGVPDSMVTFGWVMLHRGPKHGPGPASPADEVLSRHRRHLESLRASGRLIFAGDIEGTDDLRAVLVMQGDSAQVMREVLDDPAVREERFTPKMLRWWTAWGTIPGH